jgi:selenocysteine lyase/cysteine desulfurase
LNSLYEIKKRRYLNRARIAFNDKDILSKFVKHLSEQETFNPQDFSLRKTISKLFFLTEDMAFRQNATQTFRDVLEGIVYHKKPQTNFNDFRLLVSDIDHPVMTQMASAILPKEYIHEAKFLEQVILNDTNSKDDIVEIFLNNIERFKIKMVLIPHVNWINGAKFDVVSICKQIKKFNANIITIVDGAQALANTETIIDGKQCNSDIDFYIGSGQKWMGSPMPIGFVRVAKKYLKIESFRDYLFISDYFSGFAGNLKYLDKLSQDTYNIPLSMLFDSVVRQFHDGNNQMHEHYFSEVIENLSPIRDILHNYKKIKVLDTNAEMRTGIISITGEINSLSKIHKALMENYFSNTKARIEYNGKCIPFLRISSPLTKLEKADLELFNKCFV